MSLTTSINEARKAVAAIAVPALVVLVAALQDGSPGHSGVTASEWVTIAIAALGTGGLVYGVPNARSSDPTTSTPDL